MPTLLLPSLYFRITTHRVTAELLDFERRKVVFSLDRFRKFTKTHQAVLLPPVQILETLQKKTLGVVTWERLAEKRTKLSNGRYLSVKKFIALVSIYSQFIFV